MREDYIHKEFDTWIEEKQKIMRTKMEQRAKDVVLVLNTLVSILGIIVMASAAGNGNIALGIAGFGILYYGKNTGSD